jgi:hypothetical protein
LTAARLETDSMGFLTRLKSSLTLSNEGQRRITEVEWRIDVYDESLRSQNRRVSQTDKTNIYPGETATVSSKFGAVLPDKMVVLLELVRVSFDDETAWFSPVVSELESDLRTIACKPR